MTNRCTGRAFCAVVVAAFAISHEASAWADDPPTPPADPNAPPPAVTPATTPDAPKPAQEEPPVPDIGHLRWGLSPMAGTFFPGPTTVALGFEGRVGWSFNHMVSVYGNITAVAGIGFGESSGSGSSSVSVSAISYWQFGANIDALLAGPLFVGGGLGIGKAGWGVVKASGSSTGGSSDVIAAGGIVPSLDGRFGVFLGSLNKQTGTRSGLTIALDVRVLIAPNATETKQSASATGAVDEVDTKAAVGVCPMLMLGYDFR